MLRIEYLLLGKQRAAKRSASGLDGTHLGLYSPRPFRTGATVGANDPITYMCVDIEASGPVPGLFNMISLGAVPVRLVEGSWLVDEIELYQEYKPVFPGWDEGAEKIHGIPRAHLEENGLELEPAMRALKEWAKGHSKKTRCVFVGHNAPFDW